MRKHSKHSVNLRKARQKTHVSSINGIMAITHFSTKEVKLLERFAEFKLGYIDSIIYDYSPRKILKHGKVSLKSVHTIEWTINKFIEYGWAKLEQGNLKLTSKKELRKLYKAGKKLSRFSVKVETGKTRYEYQSIAMKIVQDRKDYHKVGGNKALLKISKYTKEVALKSHNFRKHCGFVCDLSYGYLSMATKVPATTCRRAIKQMERKGVILAWRQKRECLGKITQKCFESIKEQGFYRLGIEVKNLFYHKGYLFHVPNNNYLLFPSRR